MKFGIKNYKSLKESVEFELRPLTIITGPNGSGKSTYIETYQIIKNILPNPPIELSNKQISTIIEDFNNLTNWESKDKPITFFCSLGINDKYTINADYTFSFGKYTLSNIRLYLNDNIITSGNLDFGFKLNLKELHEFIYLDDDDHNEKLIDKNDNGWDIKYYPDSRKWTYSIHISNDFKDSILSGEIKDLINALNKKIDSPDFEFIWSYSDKSHFVRTLINDSLDHQFKLFDLTRNHDRFKWIRATLKKIGIADSLYCELSTAPFYKVDIIKNNKVINLCNLSNGLRKLVCFIIYISSTREWSSSLDYNHPQIVSIEEPENSLHPKLQSMLADIFETLGIDEQYEAHIPNYLVETHSEYFIRKLQYFVAKKKIKKENIAIYYFEDAFNGVKGPPRKIEIYNDGTLSQEFGSGFFDEADKIAMELFKFQSNRAN